MLFCRAFSQILTATLDDNALTYKTGCEIELSGTSCPAIALPDVFHCFLLSLFSCAALGVRLVSTRK